LTTQLSQIETVDQALAHALEFEKATLVYYQALRDVLDQQEPLAEIIAAEKQHVVTIADAIAGRK
jgi:hypothetical protein